MSTSATDPSASPPATEHAASDPSIYNTKTTTVRRQRVPRACDSCRRKKIRCNLSQTTSDNPAIGAADQQDAAEEGVKKCQNCKQSGTPCLFTKTPAKRGPSKGYIQQLESRLAALESSTHLDYSNTPGNTLPPMAPYAGVRRAADDNASAFSTSPAKKARVVGGLPAVNVPETKQEELGSSNALRPYSGYSPKSSKSPKLAAPARDTPSVLAPAPSPPIAYSRPPSSPFTSNKIPHSLSAPHLPNISSGLPANSQKAALPPISRLLSQVPSTGAYVSPHIYHPYYPPQQRHRDAHPASAPLPRSRSPHAPGRPHTSGPAQLEETPRVWTSVTAGTSLVRPRMSGHHSATSAIQTASVASSARSFEKRSPTSTSPTAPFHTSITRSSTPASQLGRLERSSILSLDTLPLRRALFATPALKTFALLPSSILETGFGECHDLIKIAYQLAKSTATMQLLNDPQWHLDFAEIVGQCMVPTSFAVSGAEEMCRQVETLSLCYVDAIRRGRYVSGILGCISGKLGDMQARGVDCNRYKASLTLLSVWNCVGFSSRTSYYTVPKADRPDDLYEALQGSDPGLRAVCIFTGALDSMCRRYAEDPAHTIPPETLELSLPAVIEHHVELPGKQARLLATLDSYLLLLNFMYNNRTSTHASLEILDRQRRHIYNILNECEACGVTSLVLGAHVLSLSAVVTVYCLSVCLNFLTTTELAGHRLQLCQALQRDYLNILDTLKNILTTLSTPPETAVFNSHPFADSGDSRILYSIVASYIKLHVSAAAQSRDDLLRTDEIILSFNALGYLGHVLSVTEAQATNPKTA